MARILDDATELAWARLVRASQTAVSAIEADLKAAGLPPLGCYDVLLELDRAAGEGLRMRDLGREVLLERYNTTRVVDRLEAQGLATREACPEDARGAIVRITDKGRRLRAEMWPVYARAIKDRFGDRFSETEAAELARLLGRLTPRPDAKAGGAKQGRSRGPKPSSRAASDRTGSRARE